MPKTQATITAIERSPSGTVAFIYCKPEEMFPFQEWQFVMISAAWVVDENGKEIRRAYSIATTQEIAEKEGVFWFIVKYAHPWGMSKHLTEKVQVWDTITVDWAYGRLVDKPWHKRYLFVSVGSGLSPMLGLFRAVSKKTETEKIVMLYGERYLEYVLPSTIDLFAQSEKYTTDTLDMACYLFLSKEESEPQWAIKRQTWHVQNWLDEALQILEADQHKEDILVYVCGMPAMADDVKEKLLAIGIAKEQMHFEKY